MRGIFPIRLSEQERQTLQTVAQAMRRTQADAIRVLIEEAALQLKEGTKQCTCH